MPPPTLPHVDGVSHRWVTARGVRFHLAEAGAGPDAVVLLHGFPQHWYQWRALLPALADRHRVIAVDLRGFGWSDAPPCGYGKEDLADDVLALLDALGLPRVGLVGHDWGGWIGFLMCLRAPERIERFLALSIVHPWARGAAGRRWWRFWYQLVLACPGVGYLAQRTRWFTRLLLRLGAAERWRWDPAVLSAYVDVQAEPARARAGVRLYRTFLLRELGAILRGRYAGRRLTVPTRLLLGAEDFALDRTMARGGPVPVEVVDGCGHFLVDECPEVVTARAAAFFDR
jgi:pimeloyl-ACP methyl ester carboxylesterase